MNQQYDNRGKVSLWKKAPDAPPSAPVLKGKVYAHRNIREGEELDLALWKNESNNPKAPTLTGKLSDPYQKQPAQYNAPQADPVPFDDDLPF